LNTFLPYPSFAHSVAVLDRERLGKQRIECRQILTALRHAQQGRQMGWSNHPATKMWAGHDSALAVYMTFCIREWVARGYNNTMVAPYDADWRLAPGEDYKLLAKGALAPLPGWLGDEKFHASHRANLLRKAPEYYGQFGWTDDPAQEYSWPIV
jgi:hypothetical protein